MNRGPPIFLGLFFALASSWYGMVLEPQLELGRLVETNSVSAGETYPVPRPGQASQGLQVYRANGCVECHSQQVRPTPADLERWGKRRTVAEDYLYDRPVPLGAQRVGPDLANLALRPRTEAWHLAHLYAPRSVVPGSTMPPYPFLFETRKRGTRPAPDALQLPAGFAPPPGWEVVPKPEANELVAYLNSLKADAALFDAPLPLPPGATNAAAAGTNAPASATSRQHE